VSFPVGKVDRLRIFPLDLEEFFWALGIEGETNSIKASIAGYEMPLFSSAERELFQQYLAIGGMPRAVQTWIDSKDINQVDLILKNILADYQDDFSKHTTGIESKKITTLWRSIPAQFAKENHKFSYKAVDAAARGRDYQFAFEWLMNAGLAIKVALVAHGDKLPLSAYVSQNDFKLYVLDVGLLRVLAKLPASVVIGEDDIWSQFGGVFAEQFVLQQLISQGTTDVYYWVGGMNGGSLPKGRSEVDFIINYDQYIIPVEVKSGINIKAKSLKIYRGKYTPVLAVRFSLRPLSCDAGLLNIPLYYSFIFNDLLEIGAKNVADLEFFRAKEVEKGVA
jgi:predicted AAA+ superfamily ATPase